MFADIAICKKREGTFGVWKNSTLELARRCLAGRLASASLGLGLLTLSISHQLS
jgi:hypothetical protein